MATVYPAYGDPSQSNAGYPPQAQGYYPPPGTHQYDGQASLPGQYPGSYPPMSNAPNGMMAPTQPYAPPPMSSYPPPTTQSYVQPTGAVYPPGQAYGSGLPPGQPYPQVGVNPGQGYPQAAAAYPGYGTNGVPVAVAQPLPGGGGYPQYPTAGAYGQVPIPMATTTTTTTNTASEYVTGRWKADLFGCMESCVPNCCMSTCCPCVTLAQIYTRMGTATYWTNVVRLAGLYLAPVVLNVVLQVRGKGTTTSSGQGVNGSSMVISIIVLLSQFAFFASIVMVRSRIRARFQIPGSCCEDCCAALWCRCCTLAQMATHIKSYTPGSCDFGGPDLLPAYP